MVCHSEQSEESPTANVNRSFAYAQDDRLDGLCISPIWYDHSGWAEAGDVLQCIVPQARPVVSHKI